jgi:hypothetical protein
MVPLIKLFLVCPATEDMPTVIIRLTVPPKKPVMEYPTTGAAARYDQVLFQMMAQPAMTGRHVRMSMMILMLLMREPRYPVTRMTMKQSPPRGNWKRIEWRVDQPKVLTMSGPNPETAPFMVYLSISARSSNRGKRRPTQTPS